MLWTKHGRLSVQSMCSPITMFWNRSPREFSPWVPPPSDNPRCQIPSNNSNLPHFLSSMVSWAREGKKEDRCHYTGVLVSSSTVKGYRLRKSCTSMVLNLWSSRHFRCQFPGSLTSGHVISDFCELNFKTSSEPKAENNWLGSTLPIRNHFLSLQQWKNCNHVKDCCGKSTILFKNHHAHLLPRHSCWIFKEDVKYYSHCTAHAFHPCTSKYNSISPWQSSRR